jgi:hypothetical protein
LVAVARSAVASIKMVTRMDGFYAYVVDPNGHVVSRVDLELESEEAAIERAKQLVDGHDVELWQRDRKIAVHSQPVKPP